MKTGNGSPDEIKIVCLTRSRDLASSRACVTGDIVPFKPIKCTLNSILAKNNLENEHRYSHLSQFHKSSEHLRCSSAMLGSHLNIFGNLRKLSEYLRKYGDGNLTPLT